MLCATHKLIANCIYNTLITEHNFALDYESLLKGSVAPDTKPSMVVIPHTKGHSIGFLTKQINSLTNAQAPVSRMESKEFSYTLGVIIHFLSDYFCLAHNNIKYLNPISHQIYEHKLKYYFKKRMKNSNINKLFQDTNIPFNIHEFISEQHQIYLSKKRTMNNDYTFSLETTMKVSASIISHCINNSSPNISIDNKKSA